jgi:phosphohistidine phosphatase
VKQLLLLRHAEAEPAAAGILDFDRALSERGRREAEEAAEVISAAQLSIDECLVSPARRTRETVAIVTGKLGLTEVPTELMPTLYLAGPDAMREALYGARGSSHTLLVVGHNPGISELASQLCGDTPGVTLRTGGVCQLTFSTDDWAELAAQPAVACIIMR